MSLSKFNPFGSATAKTLRYISAKEAQDIDSELMGSEGAFSLDQVRLIHHSPLKSGTDEARDRTADGTSRLLDSPMRHSTVPSRTQSRSRREWNEAKES